MGRTSRKYGLLSRVAGLSLVILFNLNNSLGQELRAGFCRAPDYLNIEYQTAIKKSINRLMTILDPNFRKDVRFIECLEIPPSTFYASPEAIYGREEAMAMMVEASYWSASILALKFNNTIGTDILLSNCCELDWIDSYRIAKARLYFQYEELDNMENKIQDYMELSDRQMAKVKSLVEELHYSENEFWESGKVHTKEFELAHSIYKAIIDNLVSFIIGHELFHFNDNSQILITKSNIEQNGLFDKLFSLQQYKKLFDPYLVNSDKDEINADISGFRFLQLIDSNTRHEVNNTSLQSAIRKYTIDLLAFPVLSGFDLASLSYDSPVKTAYISGYLYPMIRMMMITAVLKSNEREDNWAIKICGNTSKAIVTLIQNYASSYDKSDGNIPDEVLDLLPDGVKTGLDTNSWNESSFKCEPK